MSGFRNIRHIDVVIFPGGLGTNSVVILIRNFLGRERSIQPYLKTLGIKSPGEAKGGPSEESNPGAAKPATKPKP